MRSFKPQNIPAPPFCILWSQIPKDKKLALEIGSGNGLHSLKFSHRNPEWFLFSLERTALKSKRFFELQKKFPRSKENLYYIRADGLNVITHDFPERHLDKIFLLYPNPYVKAKQANLRWHNMSFFPFLLQRLKSRGEIELRTNLKWYADEFRERATREHGLHLQSDEILPARHLPDTTFEKKYLERGETCLRLIFTTR